MIIREYTKDNVDKERWRYLNTVAPGARFFQMAYYHHADEMTCPICLAHIDAVKHMEVATCSQCSATLHLRGSLLVAVEEGKPLKTDREYSEFSSQADRIEAKLDRLLYLLERREGEL